MGSSTERNPVSLFVIQCEKRQKLFYWLVQYCASSKRVELKFMKDIKSGWYSSMLEMVAELNANIAAELKTINLHSDSFDICFDSNSFSDKAIVTMSHGVSIKIEG